MLFVLTVLTLALAASAIAAPAPSAPTPSAVATPTRTTSAGDIAGPAPPTPTPTPRVCRKRNEEKASTETDSKHTATPTASSHKPEESPALKNEDKAKKDKRKEKGFELTPKCDHDYKFNGRPLLLGADFVESSKMLYSCRYCACNDEGKVFKHESHSLPMRWTPWRKGNDQFCDEQNCVKPFNKGVHAKKCRCNPKK